ncbi:MAG: hypothetical protein ACK4HB_04860 [Candidatus Bipolaricaulia bacterium]
MTDKKLPTFTEQIRELMKRGSLDQLLEHDSLLHSFKSLVIASDYSGEGSGFKVRTYAFLLSSLPMLRLWSEEAQNLRKKYGVVGLMEYKDLDDGKRQRALPDWISL